MVSGGEQEVATLWDLRDGRRIASFTHQSKPKQLIMNVSLTGVSEGCYIFAVTVRKAGLRHFKHTDTFF